MEEMKKRVWIVNLQIVSNAGNVGLFTAVEGCTINEALEAADKLVGISEQIVITGINIADEEAKAFAGRLFDDPLMVDLDE